MERPLSQLSRGRKARKDSRVIADMVYESVRDAILSAQLRPNRRLVEDEIAEWLQVSRTPVRESLLRLEQEGLVERDRGWIVREIDPIEIRARLECRLAIEAFAARLAAIRKSAADVERLRELCAEMERSQQSRIEFNRLNDEFHAIITQASDNPMLVKLVSQTRMNYWDLSVPVVFTPEIDQKIHRQHRGLVNAIAEGNGDEAEAIARDHVRITIDVVLGALGLNG
jgi:GntR family transcriptional regulator, rspAB operon transcriptional repressor